MMSITPIKIVPITAQMLAQGSNRLLFARLVDEWAARGDFWKLDSCLETMAKMDVFLSSAATPHEGGPWMGWYLASCQAGACELLYIYTAEAARGQKIGTRLMDDLVARATNTTDIDAIFLEVRPSNHAAVRLYESKGFTHISSRKRYYSNGDDALVYQRPIIRP